MIQTFNIIYKSIISFVLQVQVIATTLYFTLGLGLGYIVLTRIYEMYGGSNTFLFGAFILAINLGFSKYAQPRIINNRHKGRLYGGDGEKRYEKIERKTTEMV